MNDKEALKLAIDKLDLAMIASCTCTTKTHEIEYHNQNCRYRLICEAQNLITATAPDKVEAEDVRPVVGGDPAEPRDDSDRAHTKPIGYLPAHELGRLNSGHDANLRSAKFGPSELDGDVPVYIDLPPSQPEKAEDYPTPREAIRAAIASQSKEPA